MRDDDLAALEEAARAATPGPWEADDRGPTVSSPLLPDTLADFGWNGGTEQTLADAAFVAAANPDAVLALTCRLREALALLRDVPMLTHDNGCRWWAGEFDAGCETCVWGRRRANLLGGNG